MAVDAPNLKRKRIKAKVKDQTYAWSFTLVELEGQLSNPGYKFKKLLDVWRSLPGGIASRTKPTSPRPWQRSEDKLGPDGVAQLVANYQAGESTKMLQRTYALSQGAVLRLLDLAGVPRRRRGLTDAQVQEAIELYAQGWSLTRIGDHFGKDHTVVRNALLRSGHKLRR